MKDRVININLPEIEVITLLSSIEFSKYSNPKYELIRVNPNLSLTDVGLGAECHWVEQLNK